MAVPVIFFVASDEARINAGAPLSGVKQQTDVAVTAVKAYGELGGKNVFNVF